MDVLAWQQATGLVYAIECKSLRFDRTLGEIGQRLAEYSAGTVGVKRTPLQKHLDRISCLEANRERLAAFTSMTVDRLQPALGAGDGEGCFDAIRRKGARDAGSRYGLRTARRSASESMTTGIRGKAQSSPRGACGLQRCAHGQDMKP